MGYQTDERDLTQRWKLYRPEDFSGRRVVDLGCSQGLDTRMFAQSFGAVSSTGVDVIPVPDSSGQVRFIQTDASKLRTIPCDTLVCNSVARWVGQEAIVRWIREASPKVVYLETHSEEDPWSWEVLRMSGLIGWDFVELGRVPYMKADPRPIRRMLRGERNPEFIFKVAMPSRRLHLGVGFAALKAFAEIGLPVPTARQWSADAYAVERLDSRPASEWKVDLEVFRQVLVCQWLIGNCSVRDPKGNLIRDKYGSACHSEVHPGNMSFDGRRMVYFDFDHAFCHLLWLKGLPATIQPLSEVIPEYDIGDIRKTFLEALSLPPKEVPEFKLQPNRWLSPALAQLANRIVSDRRRALGKLS